MMTTGPEILCCPLSAIDDALLAEYRTLLSRDEQQRLAKFRIAAAAKEFTVGRVLLRNALAERLQYAPTALEFARDDDGKPYLSSPTNGRWHFNLSHDQHWVVLILSQAGPVGIDIESHQRRNNLHGIAERFFSAAENNALAQCAEDAWLDYFFAIWTLKEAHAKARGCGLAKILSCSSITLDWPAARIDFELHDIARSEIPLSGWLYRLDDDVSLAAIANADSFLIEPAIARVIPLRAEDALSIKPLGCGSWRP